MKKIIYIICVVLFSNQLMMAQKLQLTEAATEYKNNFSPSWMVQPDQLEKNKSVLVKAKKAIDECYMKHLETPLVKEKDVTKMYYYRGMIYLDYTMMAAMDVEIKSDLMAMDEKSIDESSLGSLKKCLEIDSRGDWEDQIKAKINMLRSMMINVGVEMFNKNENETAFQSFATAVDIYSVIGVDTVAMLNAALAADRMKNYEEAYKYYRLCADNNYGKGAEMYHFMIRTIISNDSIENVDLLGIIEEGKKKHPNDFYLNVEEFNYWHKKGNSSKAQAALQKAVEADPDNKDLHFNIGHTYDKMSKEAHKAGKIDAALEFFNKSAEAYKNAIELDADYADAYYSLGYLYYFQALEIKNIAGDLADQAQADIETAKANKMMLDAIPFLETSLKFDSKDVNALKILGSIYFNIDNEEKYMEIKAQLKELGQ